jgi:hypothetical protein
MALIFSEGFENSRTVASKNSSNLPDVWQFTDQNSSYFSVSNNGRTGLYGALLSSESSGSSAKLSFFLTPFTVTGTQLFFGFAVKDLSTARGTAGTTLPRNFLRLFNAASESLFSLVVEKETTGDTAMKLQVITGTNTVTAEYTLTEIPVTFNGTGASAYLSISNWLYFEVKLDFNANTLALRAQGMPVFKTGTTSNETSLPSGTLAMVSDPVKGTIPNLNSIQFCAETNVNSMYLDDFYILDNTGTTDLVATLATGTALVTLTTGTTANLFAGQALTKTSGIGAFGATPTVLSVQSATQFTASVNHATAGEITFSAGGTGEIPKSFLGPCKIYTPNFSYNTFGANEFWGTSGSAWWSALTSNDQDNSYVSSGTVGKKQLLTFAQTSPGNNAAITINDDEYIAGVQLTSVIRRTSLDSAVRPVYKSAVNTYTPFGPATPITNELYATKVFVAQKNPVTTAVWEATDVFDLEDVINKSFGLEIVDPATLPSS